MGGRIIIIAGATASGKSALAMRMAQELSENERQPCVIINADSMQVYREIPIITAQPTAEDKLRQPHRLYGYISASEHCSVARWLDAAKQEIDLALSRNITPILVGGTGLYIKCLMHGIADIPDILPEIRDKSREMLEKLGNIAFYNMLAERDPVMGMRLKPEDSQRILRAWEVIEQTGKSLAEWQEAPNKTFYPPEYFDGYFLNLPREELYQRVNERFDDMVKNGVPDEIRVLDKMQLSLDLPAMRAHGVPELLACLHGNMRMEDAVERAKRNTRHYVKRQFTWWRSQLPDLKTFQR